VGVSGEIGFDTPLGPGKITIRARHGYRRGWPPDDQ